MADILNVCGDSPMDQNGPKVPLPSPDKWHAAKAFGSNHYKTDSVEPIDLIRAAGYLEGFAMGNIIKYAFRIGSSRRRVKDKIRDIGKIAHYAQLYEASLEGRE